MKILSTAWLLFKENINGIDIDRNGGSIMIADICEYIGRRVESYVFIGSRRISSGKFGSIRILDNQEYLPDERKTENIKEWQEGLKHRFHDILDEIKPDIVLVHGGLDFSMNCMEICREQHQPYAYVDHLMMSGNAGFQMSKEAAMWEKQVFEIPNIHVIAVGNGMRDKILKENPKLSEDQVVAIPNGTPLKGELAETDIKDRYNLKGKKVLLCSGSLQPRKNQLQLVGAFQMLSKEEQEEIVIIFCGSASTKDGYKEILLKKINMYGLQKKLIYVGSFPREEMKKVYSCVDGLVMVSLSEGLSLVALEMLRYGKPILLFEDNETAVDINDERLTILIKDHSDQAVANALSKWLKTEWDEKYIRMKSNYYDIERVADDYVRYCQSYI